MDQVVKQRRPREVVALEIPEPRHPSCVLGGPTRNPFEINAAIGRRGKRESAIAKIDGSLGKRAVNHTQQQTNSSDEESHAWILVMKGFITEGMMLSEIHMVPSHLRFE
jgi:hypothetical protein